MTTAEQQASELAADALAALGRVRRVWPWLAEARLPGVPGTAALVERQMSVQAERVEADQVRRDRKARTIALRNGLVGLSGPMAPPARLIAVRARQQVAAHVRGVAGRLGVTQGLMLPQALADPSLSRTTSACPWCHGTGTAQRPPGWQWHWPDPAPSCSLCGGHARSCDTCGQFGAGGCHCDVADVVVDACLDAVSAALPVTGDPDVVAWCANVLGRADRIARTALGLSEVDLRIIKAPCPACGRRDLRADVASPKRHEWSVACHSPLCRCAGPGCGCQRPVRWEGRRHRWPAHEFADLAALIGVAPTALER